MNVFELAQALRNMTDQQLVQLAQQHQNDAAIMAAVMNEKTRRDKLRASVSAAPAPQGQQPTVREQMLAGLDNIPTEGMTSMADGGIVSFADGGSTAPWQTVKEMTTRGLEGLKNFGTTLFDLATGSGTAEAALLPTADELAAIRKKRDSGQSLTAREQILERNLLIKGTKAPTPLPAPSDVGPPPVAPPAPATATPRSPAAARVQNINDTLLRVRASSSAGLPAAAEARSTGATDAGSDKASVNTPSTKSLNLGDAAAVLESALKKQRDAEASGTTPRFTAEERVALVNHRLGRTSESPKKPSDRATADTDQSESDRRAIIQAERKAALESALAKYEAANKAGTSPTYTPRERAALIDYAKANPQKRITFYSSSGAGTQAEKQAEAEKKAGAEKQVKEKNADARRAGSKNKEETHPTAPLDLEKFFEDKYGVLRNQLQAEQTARETALTTRQEGMRKQLPDEATYGQDLYADRVAKLEAEGRDDAHSKNLAWADALIAMGAAMMGSKSPTFFGALGEGVKAGSEEYARVVDRLASRETRRQDLQMKIEEARSQIKFATAKERRDFDRQSAVELQQLRLENAKDLAAFNRLPIAANLELMANMDRDRRKHGYEMIQIKARGEAEAYARQAGAVSHSKPGDIPEVQEKRLAVLTNEIDDLQKQLTQEMVGQKRLDLQNQIRQRQDERRRLLEMPPLGFIQEGVRPAK